MINIKAEINWFLQKASLDQGKQLLSFATNLKRYNHHFDFNTSYHTLIHWFNETYEYQIFHYVAIKRELMGSAIKKGLYQ